MMQLSIVGNTFILCLLSYVVYKLQYSYFFYQIAESGTASENPFEVLMSTASLSSMLFDALLPTSMLLLGLMLLSGIPSMIIGLFITVLIRLVTDTLKAKTNNSLTLPNEKKMCEKDNLLFSLSSTWVFGILMFVAVYFYGGHYSEQKQSYFEAPSIQVNNQTLRALQGQCKPYRSATFTMYQAYCGQAGFKSFATHWPSPELLAEAGYMGTDSQLSQIQLTVAWDQDTSTSVKTFISFVNSTKPPAMSPDMVFKITNTMMNEWSDTLEGMFSSDVSNSKSKYAQAWSKLEILTP